MTFLRTLLAVLAGVAIGVWYAVPRVLFLERIPNCNKLRFHPQSKFWPVSCGYANIYRTAYDYQTYIDNWNKEQAPKYGSDILVWEPIHTTDPRHEPPRDFKEVLGVGPPVPTSYDTVGR